MKSDQYRSADSALLTPILQLGGDPADLPFWQACSEGDFLLHRCNVCQQHYWPASRCVEHGNQSMEWVKTSGRGHVYTYTLMHRSHLPAFKDKVPFAVVVIQLDEGPFFHSNMIGCTAEEVHVGMRVAAVMNKHGNGLTIPVFQPE